MTKVIDGISGITKNIIFFPIWRPVRGETMIFVCSYGCVVSRLHCYGKWQQMQIVLKTVTLHIRKNTQKSKFLLSQAFKWKKIMFFVIPKMPSKTFVMLYKKLPDHFKIPPCWYNKIHSFMKPKPNETLTWSKKGLNKLSTYSERTFWKWLIRRLLSNPNEIMIKWTQFYQKAHDTFSLP